MRHVEVRLNGKEQYYVFLKTSLGFKAEHENVIYRTLEEIEKDYPRESYFIIIDVRGE
jgi:hypothetical protein